MCHWPHMRNGIVTIVPRQWYSHLPDQWKLWECSKVLQLEMLCYTDETTSRCWLWNHLKCRTCWGTRHRLIDEQMFGWRSCNNITFFPCNMLGVCACPIINNTIGFAYTYTLCFYSILYLSWHLVNYILIISYFIILRLICHVTSLIPV